MTLDDIIEAAKDAAVANVAARSPQPQKDFHHISIDPNFSGPHKSYIVSHTIFEWKNDKLVAKHGTFTDFFEAKAKAIEVWGTVGAK